MNKMGAATAVVVYLGDEDRELLDRWVSRTVYTVRDDTEMLHDVWKAACDLDVTLRQVMASAVVSAALKSMGEPADNG